MLLPRRKLVTRSWNSNFLLVLAAAVFFSVGARAEDARSVRVGVTSNPPISLHNPAGPPSGLAVDVINEVAGRENWRVTFIQDIWPNLLSRFEAGEIDIIAGVGYSEKRTRQFDFTSEALVSNWGVIYRRPQVSIGSVADLEGKRIALPRKGIHTVAFHDLLKQFSVKFSPVWADDFNDALDLVQRGKADAAVVARLFGIVRAPEYDVVGTAINFNPVEVRLVTPKGQGVALRAAIDRYLSVEKKEPGSSYHVYLSHWLETSAGGKIPLWLVWGSGGAFVGLCLTLVIIWLLGRRVTAHTTALVESEERFRATFEQAAVGIAHVGLDGRWLRVNQRLCDILGYTAEELKALSFLDVTPPETREADESMIGPLIRGETDVYATEKSYLCKDGSLVPINLTVATARASDGKALYFISVIEDITERKQAEEALRESEAALEEAQRIAKIGNWRWSIPHDNLISCSAEYAQIHGIDPDQIHHHMKFQLENVIHASDRARVEKEFRRFDEIGVDFDIEYRIVRPNGEVRHVLEIGRAVIDDNSRPIEHVGTIQDITDQRRAEEQLRQAQKMEAVGQLTAGVAHDFNNMLAVTWGNAELLEDEIGKDNPKLARIFRATRRGGDLTQRLLAFSRKQVLNPEIINTNNLIADITGLLRRTLEEHIEIETVTAADLWNCEVDPAQLENALVNLAINARDAMPKGGKLTIETSNTRLDDDYAAAQVEVRPGQYVMLAVTDNGSGMPLEVQERVFEPFYTTKAVGAGSGLGLSMVYGFVKQSGGNISIYSELGEGTTIKLYLPRSTETTTAKKKPMTDEVPVARGETVLVVEDDPEVRTLAVALLSSLGYQIMEAATAAAALEQLGSMKGVNLLLTDVMLAGGMNGRELAVEAKQCAPGIPVLFMSGYTENAIVHHGRLDDDAELLQKPFRRADLARAVRRAFDSPST